MEINKYFVRVCVCVLWCVQRPPGQQQRTFLKPQVAATSGIQLKVHNVKDPTTNLYCPLVAGCSVAEGNDKEQANLKLRLRIDLLTQFLCQRYVMYLSICSHFSVCYHRIFWDCHRQHWAHSDPRLPHYASAPERKTDDVQTKKKRQKVLKCEVMHRELCFIIILHYIIFSWQNFKHLLCVTGCFSCQFLTFHWQVWMQRK